uniref:Uncharacterized protein n=1 Tax=uncultured bacterium A1Q1_fos_1880 TaxID=1256556 RepID=L7VWQ6_9BACT|nr:hypothetical protein [uncultured bacterium A1Q1_fos_1880]
MIGWLGAVCAQVDGATIRFVNRTNSSSSVIFLYVVFLYIGFLSAFGKAKWLPPRNPCAFCLYQDTWHDEQIALW